MELSLEVKLGSILVHVEEMLSKKEHLFDRIALKSLLEDEEVRKWLENLNAMGLLPVKR